MGSSTLSRRQLLRWRLSPQDVDYDGWTRRVRAESEPGAREPLRQALQPVAGTLVELAGVGAGQRVLDAAGDGSVAQAASERGARVDTSDLLDLVDLPYPDGLFDAVISAFGFTLEPRVLRTARELARVCRPGGTVALAAWVPRGLPGALEEHVERPHGIPSPALWGREPRLRARLEPLLGDVVVRLRTVTLEFPSPDALFEQLVAPSQTDALRAPFDRLLARSNLRRPLAVIGARHLLVTGTALAHPGVERLPPVE